MAAIELGYAAPAGSGRSTRMLVAWRRMWRRRYLLSRIRRRNADLAFIAMAMDERQLVDLGLQNRRRRYGWIGQIVMAMTLR